MEAYRFSETLEDTLHQELLLMPYLLNLPQVYKDSSLGQKHAIVNEVFKQGLTFKEGVFRTPFINPEFECNLLILKEKGLLYKEQPSREISPVPLCGDKGSPLQHLEGLLFVLRDIYSKRNM